MAGVGAVATQLADTSSTAALRETVPPSELHEQRDGSNGASRRRRPSLFLGVFLLPFSDLLIRIVQDYALWMRMLNEIKAEKSGKKAKAPSASSGDFSLGDAAFQALKAAPLSPFDLRSGHAYPGRLAREGLLRVSTVGAWKQLLGAVLASGDPGQKTLCTFVIGRIQLSDKASDEQRRLWQSVALAPDDSVLDSATLAALSKAASFRFITHDVRGSKRGRNDLDRPTRESARVATELAAVAQETGGTRALSVGAYHKYMAAYFGARGVLWRAALLRALRGARRLRVRSRHKRRMADVQALCDGIARFRALLLAEATSDADKEALRACLRSPATKFDDGVFVIIGQQLKRRAGDKPHQRGHKAAPMHDFVEQVAKRFRTMTVSEFYTSQKCTDCGAQLKRTRGGQVRFVRCEHSPLNGSGDATLSSTKNFVLGRGGKRRHVAEQNKDHVAALSMARIGVWLLCFGTRPAEWATYLQRTVLEQRLAPAATRAAGRRSRAPTSKARGKRKVQDSSTARAASKKAKMAVKKPTSKRKRRDGDDEDERELPEPKPPDDDDDDNDGSEATEAV
jgi:hypothetical protein